MVAFVFHQRELQVVKNYIELAYCLACSHFCSEHGLVNKKKGKVEQIYVFGFNLMRIQLIYYVKAYML